MSDQPYPLYPQNTYKALTEDDSDEKIERFVGDSFLEFYDAWRTYISDFEDDLFFY